MQPPAPQTPTPQPRMRYLRAPGLPNLRDRLQTAVELEHSTIPPYLTAFYSLKPGVNDAIAEVIHSVVMEEMTHMALAANVLNAIGGAPSINHALFVPEYPTGLPGGVRKDLTVGLKRFSLDVVRDTFMSIEAPHDPYDPRILLRTGQTFDDTIGEFYKGIEDDMTALAAKENIFTGDPARQVATPFITPVRNLDEALQAMRNIVDQGEGISHEDPFDLQGEPAHYYRFEEILKGRKMTPDGGGSFDGDPVPFDPAGVWPLLDNTKRKDVADGTQAADLLDAFNGAYWRLLNGLHVTFNGKPDYLHNAVGAMFEVKVLALKLVQTPVPGMTDGTTLGPSFEYAPQAGL